MSGQDRILAGIAIGALVLVLLAFGIALTREGPSYRGGDAPDDVVHDYLVALRLEDTDRAWSVLSPGLPGYPPSPEAFLEDVTSQPWQFELEDVDLEVGEARIDEETGIALVPVLVTSYYSGGLFDSGRSESRVEFRLRDEDGVWRIDRGDRFFWDCWRTPEEDRCRELIDLRRGDEG